MLQVLQADEAAWHGRGLARPCGSLVVFHLLVLSVSFLLWPFSVWWKFPFNPLKVKLLAGDLRATQVLLLFFETEAETDR